MMHIENLQALEKELRTIKKFTAENFPLNRELETQLDNLYLSVQLLIKDKETAQEDAVCQAYKNLQNLFTIPYDLRTRIDNLEAFLSKPVVTTRAATSLSEVGLFSEFNVASAASEPVAEALTGNKRSLSPTVLMPSSTKKIKQKVRDPANIDWEQQISIVKPSLTKVGKQNNLEDEISSLDDYYIKQALQYSNSAIGVNNLEEIKVLRSQLNNFTRYYNTKVTSTYGYKSKHLSEKLLELTKAVRALLETKCKQIGGFLDADKQVEKERIQEVINTQSDDVLTALNRFLEDYIVFMQNIEEENQNLEPREISPLENIQALYEAINKIGSSSSPRELNSSGREKLVKIVQNCLKVILDQDSSCYEKNKISQDKRIPLYLRKSLVVANLMYTEVVMGWLQAKLLQNCREALQYIREAGFNENSQGLAQELFSTSHQFINYVKSYHSDLVNPSLESLSDAQSSVSNKYSLAGLFEHLVKFSNITIDYQVLSEAQCAQDSEDRVSLTFN